MARKARAVRFDQYGGIDELYVADVVVPDPPSGEVQVAVRAAGLNPGEAAIRHGYLDERFPATFPSGEGSDLAGVVVEIGDGVTSFAVGDEVLGWTDRRQSQAEYVNVPEDHLVRKPAGLSWEVAGSLYVVGVTAYAAVRAVDAGPGDTVVVSAAAGGVGSVTVQLLRARGAKVIGIASEANHPWLTSIGVTPVAYGDGLADRIRHLAPSGVDAFIDTFGAEYVTLAVELGVAPDRIDTIIAFDAAQRVGAKTEGSSAASTPEVLAEVADLVASGAIVLPIAATFPFERVRDAYTEVEKRHTRGKIVLVP
ncbi:MAG: NADP-dependent oxidoreductase [Acidimicrobiales bacterium]|jgi:NADPH:quinone reductase-like Zn-dependent oxidoreductase